MAASAGADKSEAAVVAATPAGISAPGVPYTPQELQAKFVGMTARDVYALLCKRAGCKVVSGVSALLPDKPGVWDVQELDLSRSYVGHRGAAALIEVCKLFEGLRSIRLRDNYLTNRTVWQLCKMAAFHPSLQAIDISCNDITWTAGMCLLELATVNKRIVAINAEDTQLKPKVLEIIAAQLRINAGSNNAAGDSGTPTANASAAASSRVGGLSGHVPTNHPTSVRQRALKRHYRDQAALLVGGHANVTRETRVPRAALIEGHKELQRLSGKDTEPKSAAFYDNLSRRARGETVDWEEYCLLLMLDDIVLDAKSVESLRAVFAKFDPHHAGHVAVSDLAAIMQSAYGSAPTPTEVAAMKAFYSADDTMTLTWDEFLLLMYDHGPTVGRLSTFHTSTPLRKVGP